MLSMSSNIFENLILMTILYYVVMLLYMAILLSSGIEACHLYSSLSFLSFPGILLFTHAFSLPWLLLVIYTFLWAFMGFPGSSMVKNLSDNVGDVGSISGSERSPTEEHSRPLQYSCLGNLMGGGAWWATVHGGAKSRTWLSDWSDGIDYAFTHRSYADISLVSNGLYLVPFLNFGIFIFLDSPHVSIFPF